jgi:putative sterol carrier protein
LATELSDKVMYQCLQFFGGYGYMEEYKMARMFRDSRILTIGGGSSEIMREIIAKMVIDEKKYQAAKRAEQANGAPAPKEEDAFDKIYHIVEKNATNARALGNSLKFNLDGRYIHINGKGDANSVSRTDQDADCTISITPDDFMALLEGQLNPMNAFMAGKVKIKGDMGVAMKLQSLLG